MKGTKTSAWIVGGGSPCIYIYPKLHANWNWNANWNRSETLRKLKSIWNFTQTEIDLKLYANWNLSETLLFRVNILSNKQHNGVEGKNNIFLKGGKNQDQRNKKEERKKRKIKREKGMQKNKKNRYENAKTRIIMLDREKN